MTILPFAFLTAKYRFFSTAFDDFCRICCFVCFKHNKMNFVSISLYLPFIESTFVTFYPLLSSRLKNKKHPLQTKKPEFKLHCMTI